MADTFPITIDHLYGSTTIEQAPERILTIGWSTQDADRPRICRWRCRSTPGAAMKMASAVDARGALGDGELPALNDIDGLPFEQFIEFVRSHPRSVFRRDRGRLSASDRDRADCPADRATLGQLLADLTLVTGTALGESAAAEQVIADVDAAVQSGAAEHPELAGKTFHLRQHVQRQWHVQHLHRH
ncbi:MAG: hypothetical protein R2845_00960 [Thermomicrobiales bacterium]